MEEIARQSAASIRALRAHGPYLIGGYCYGGVVAFEAARQLLEEGAEVPLLALFDTPTPGYPKIVHDWRRFVHQGHGMLLSLAQASHSVTVKNLAAHLRALGRIAARRYMAKARRSLLAAGIRTPRGDESDNSVARREYAPRLLSAPIVHFIGADVAVSTEVLSDPRLGWRDFAGGGFEARPIPGDHVSIFSPANAPVLARELERAIQAAESASRRDEASYAAAVK